MTSTTNEIELKSTRALKRLEREASKKLKQIREAPAPPTEKARDGVIAEARRLRIERDEAVAELARREPKPERVFSDPREWRRQKEAREAVLVAERRAFHAEIKSHKDEANLRELERKRAAGLLYEPSDPGGGDAVAALFSSRALWDLTEFKIQADGYSGQILNTRHIIALWWIANLIATAGGESVTFASRKAPHWPDIDGEIPFREADLAHLVKNKFVEVERQSMTVTYRFGSRTKAIVKSYREQT